MEKMASGRTINSVEGKLEKEVHGGHGHGIIFLFIAMESDVRIVHSNPEKYKHMADPHAFSCG